MGQCVRARWIEQRAGNRRWSVLRRCWKCSDWILEPRIIVDRDADCRFLRAELEILGNKSQIDIAQLGAEFVVSDIVGLHLHIAANLIRDAPGQVKIGFGKLRGALSHCGNGSCPDDLSGYRYLEAVAVRVSV